MKKIFTLAICTITAFSAFATDYIVGDSVGIGYVMPIYTDGAKTYGSVTQQIILASDLTSEGATAGDISALTFYYTPKAGISSVGAMSRTIQIYLMTMNVDSFMIDTSNSNHIKFLCNGSNKVGTKVFEGTFATDALTALQQVKSKTITFDSNFSWDGTNNLVLTIFDMSPTSSTIGSTSSTNLRFVLAATDKPRFAHYRWYLDYKDETDDTRSAWLSNMSNRIADYYTSTSTYEKQMSGHKYVNKIKFTISTTIPAPENLNADPVGTTTATLNWDEVLGATSYNVRWGKTSASLNHSQEGVTDTHLDISDLDDGETYYFDVQAVTTDGTSAYSSEAEFATTGIAHTHDGITFTKWTSTSSLPTSGSYYLNDDVVLTAQATLSGNLNLCLNGHSIYTYTYNIVVDDEQTLAIYDYEGGGEISGHYVATFAQKGLISVLYGGTLSVKAGTINNQYDNEYGEGSIAIYSNGTLKISGAPAITGVTESIYLNTGKVITIESGKPLTNLTPYVVNGVSTVVTSGWTNMGGALPSSHFTSANSTYPGIALNGSGEAQMVKVVALDQDADNSAVISAANNQFVNASLTRSWLADGYYSTLCLPFDLSDSQITSVFGSSTEVAQLTSSSIDDEEITITFTSASSIEAGKPYIIKPTLNAVNPVFSGVTIQDIDVEDEKAATTYVDFIGTLSPTYLAASEDILFLGANNAIGWPAAAGYLKGMRAYFQLHSLPAGAPALRHARLIAPGHSTPTTLDETNENKNIQKRLENGQLIIIRDGKKYNVIGGQQ